MQAHTLAAALLLPLAIISSPAQSASAVGWAGDTQACEALGGLKVENAQVTAAAFALGADTPAFDGVTAPFSQPFCRVRLTATPALGASINYEVWLPPVSVWNGRFLGTGNGGYAGKIVYQALANGLRRGYAVANTDVGTHATTGFIQMAGDPQRLENYHQRAVHQMTVVGKAVLNAYYQRPHHYALFAGCSSGGFEAMTEAVNFPTDYNGIVAGAPGIDFAGVGLFQGYSYVQTQSKAGAAIAAGKLPAIEAEVLRQCDSSDGLIDGQLDDPGLCHANLEPLLCQDKETDRCLTRPQLDALTALRQGPLNPRTGQRYYPVFPAGAENANGALARIAHLNTGTSVLDGSPGPLTFVLGAQWTPDKWLTFNFDSDALTALAAYAPFAPSKPDLGPFRQAGGKLILFHGLRDANLFAQSTVNYYQHLQTKMGTAATEAFSRLYLVPGMDHCFGGTGPNQFGQANWQPPEPGAQETDIIEALDMWVSQGSAPAALVAARYNGNGVARTRPLCPYPQRALYRGGSIDEATSFSCQRP